MMNKKILMIVSGIFTVVTVIMGTFEPFRLCGKYWRECMDLNYIVDLTLLPIIPLFLFSLITYRMRDEVYRVWIRFSLWWIPLSMLLILLSPEYSGSMLYAITKGSVAFVTSALYVVLSLIVIGAKQVAVRK